MLKYASIILMFFLSCRPAILSAGTGPVPERLMQLIEEYEQQTMPLSCTWCRVNHPSFWPMLRYVSDHPETLSGLLQKADSDPLFRFAYIRLLQDVKPALYGRLLSAAGIPVQAPQPSDPEALARHYQRVYSMDWTLIKAESHEAGI